MVVVHRGTDPKCVGALNTDMNGIFSTNYTSCMNSAMTFIDVIRQAISWENNQHRHYITSHSIGVWLAQITTFSAKYLAIKRLENNSTLKKKTWLEYMQRPLVLIVRVPGTCWTELWMIIMTGMR